MQKDMKIGMFAGLALVVGVMFYVCTRSDFGTKARIMHREGINTEQNVIQHDEKQDRIEQMVAFGPAMVNAKNFETKTENAVVKEETRFVQEILTTKKSPHQARKAVEPKPDNIIKKQPSGVVEPPPVKTYKPKKFYIVRKGDTLSKISQKYYRTANNWYVIFDANRDIIANPNKIKVGMKLYIPDISR